MLEKSDVNGPHQNPVYSFLKKSFAGKDDITWNFSSYFLIDHHGVPVARYEKESWNDITTGIEEAVKAAKQDQKQ
jgi:glutathione peroxidase-family protein